MKFPKSVLNIIFTVFLILSLNACEGDRGKTGVMGLTGPTPDSELSDALKRWEKVIIKLEEECDNETAEIEINTDKEITGSCAA